MDLIVTDEVHRDILDLILKECSIRRAFITRNMISIKGLEKNGQEKQSKKQRKD